MEEPIPIEVVDDVDADFSAAEATIIRAISPHVDIVDQGGTPRSHRITITDVDGPEYADIYDGVKGDTGDSAGFGNIIIGMDAQNPGPGIPDVDYTASGPDTSKNLSLIFKNLKGDTGDDAGFGTPTATLDNNVGMPEVDITTSGPNTEKIFNFNFHNLKGDTGPRGDTGPKGDTGDPTRTSDLINDSGFLTSFDNLDATKLVGIISSLNLPSYVDDVIEYAGLSQFPITGESGKIYVDTTDNNTYRWTGSTYVSISNPLDYATQLEAETGSDNTKVMTPLRTRQAMDNYAMSTQAIDNAVASGLTSSIGNY